uniref:G-patch domain-containing protein n=1 Tax=Panagrellus redivivus TaxID=6233 RepID=A0A7E4V4D3_PANRE
MSILAAPRYKKRISVDPQNATWAKNEDKFGQKLMQKMGWSAGKGLGSNNQGRTDNLKLDANFTAKGLGFTGNAHEKQWIAHHDEFSALLGKLKAQKAEPAKEEESEDSESEVEEPVKKKAKTEGTSMEERSRNTTKRLHYKYTKMKDLSRYSAKDKAAVIGVGLKSAQPEPEVKPTVEEKPIPEPEQHQDTGVSVTDYFAAKMAAFYAKRNTVQSSVETVETETSVTVVETEEVEFSDNRKADNESPEVDENAEEERLRRKAEKKARKMAERAAAEAEEEERQRRKAEKKARKAAEREAAAAAAEAEEERLRLKAEKKERKRKAREAAALEE